MFNELQWSDPDLKKPPVDPNAELHEKMEKIVDILQSRGLGPPQEDPLYHWGRNLVLTFLVLIGLSFCSYVLWIIYTDDLNYEDLRVLVAEKRDDLRSLIPGSPITEEIPVELTENRKMKPEKTPRPEAHSPASRTPLKQAKLPDTPHPAAAIAGGRPPVTDTSEPPADIPETSTSSSTSDQPTSGRY